jgi:DNA topoisomerase-3
MERSETTRANISCGSIQKQEVKVEKKKVTGIATEVCPKCKKDPNKGKSAYGCSNYKAGCDFVLPTLTQKKNIREPIHTITPKGYSKFKRL